MTQIRTLLISRVFYQQLLVPFGKNCTYFWKRSLKFHLLLNFLDFQRIFCNHFKAIILKFNLSTLHLQLFSMLHSILSFDFCLFWLFLFYHLLFCHPFLHVTLILVHHFADLVLLVFITSLMITFLKIIIHLSLQVVMLQVVYFYQYFCFLSSFIVFHWIF